MSLKAFDRFNSLTSTQVTIGLTLLQCFVAAPVLMKLRQSEELTTLSRSGADPPPTLPPKIANLVMYGPSAAIAYWASTLESATKLPTMLLTHFGKQAVELFVLQSKKPGSETDQSDMIPTSAAVQTSAFYGIGTYLLLNQALPMPNGVDISQMVFWLGELGHGFHAYLLETNENKNRSLPKSGLFAMNIAAPQHLFEIITWLGISGCSRNAIGAVQTGLVVVLLAFQAKKLNDQYPVQMSRNEIGGKKRWNLIPYIY